MKRQFQFRVLGLQTKTTFCPSLVKSTFYSEGIVNFMPALGRIAPKALRGAVAGLLAAMSTLPFYFLRHRAVENVWIWSRVKSPSIKRSMSRKRADERQGPDGHYTCFSWFSQSHCANLTGKEPRNKFVIIWWYVCMSVTTMIIRTLLPLPKRRLIWRVIGDRYQKWISGHVHMTSAKFSGFLAPSPPPLSAFRTNS